MAEQPALLGQPDLRAVGELARLAEVVHERGADQQVGVQPRVQLARLERERRRPRRCARAARRGRRGGRRACTARGATRRAARRRRAARSSSAAVRRVVDLAREVLEEAVELVEVAVGDGQERGRVGAPRRARSRAPRPAARRGSARRARARARGRRARSARRARRRRGTRAPGCAPVRSRSSSARYGVPERAVSRSLREQAKTRVDLVARRAGRRRWLGGGDARRCWPAAPDATRYRGCGCSRCAGNAVPTGSGPRRSSAPSRAGTTPASPPPSALTFLGAALDADALRDDRPRGVRRLPVHAPDGARCVDGLTRDDRLARVRGLRGPHPARAARPDPALRPRAGDALAHVLRAGRRPRRGARRPDGRHARRAARRRAALAPGLGHRHRVRPRR